MAGNLVDFSNYGKAGLKNTDSESVTVTKGTPENVTVSFVNVRQWGLLVQVDLQVRATASVYLAEIATGLPVPAQRVDFFAVPANGSKRAEFWIGSGAGGSLMANMDAEDWYVHFCYIATAEDAEDPEMELF